MLLLIFGQIYNFSAHSRVAVNFNSAFQYVNLCACIIFYLASLHGHREYVLKILFRYATIYSLLYFFLAFFYVSGAVPRYLFGNMVLTDIERGERLFMYGGAATLAYFYWLFRAKTIGGVINSLMALILLASILMSLSRVFIVMVLLVTMLFLIFSRDLIIIRRICLLLLAAAILFNFYGFIDGSWNPYAVFRSDSSGRFRMMEYEVARDFIERNPIFGAGIPASAERAWILLGQDYFAASDLGVIGVMLDWGLAGMVLLIFASHIVSQPVGYARAAYRVPLLLSGCVLVASCVISPQVISSGGTVTFSIIFGFWLHEQANIKHIPVDLRRYRREKMKRLGRTAAGASSQGL
ncbi:hypothetical protein HNQ72_000855 [Rhizobium wenxiniae]|uniref:O-antigen ligase-related domain-containing protein n=1 Tax=Rhizobium wenxiniae TaxID=1737357 RepID=A0A7W9Y4K9_9HYPH|nr:O-antigen ligase family protein [Rhizobium wenxiniae]MBB6161058.1 hypothetical protein [Rhizobium wenxiniae]